MFEGIRRLISKKDSDADLGPKVSVAELDNEVEAGAEPEALEGAKGWTEPDGEVCDVAEDAHVDTEPTVLDSADEEPSDEEE